MGQKAWGRKHGAESMGQRAWGREHGAWSMGHGAWGFVAFMPKWLLSHAIAIPCLVYKCRFVSDIAPFAPANPLVLFVPFVSWWLLSHAIAIPCLSYICRFVSVLLALHQQTSSYSSFPMCLCGYLPFHLCCWAVDSCRPISILCVSKPLSALCALRALVVTLPRYSHSLFVV